MRKLKISLLSIFVFTAFTIVNGQEQIKSQEALKKERNAANIDLKSNKPEDRISTTNRVLSTKSTINISDKKVQKVNFDGISYYVIDGIWYTKFKNKYVLRQAPKGARLTFIPKGGKLVTMGGKKYYKSNGVFYKKNKDGHYEVVRP